MNKPTENAGCEHLGQDGSDRRDQMNSRGCTCPENAGLHIYCEKCKAFPIDPEFEKYLERIKALPEAKKKEIRDHLLAEAGIKPREDKKSDEPCGDNLNKEALDAAAHERTPVSPTYNPETCGHPPNERCTICPVCGKCQDPWNDDVSTGDMALTELEYFEKPLVCPGCCDKACWFCGSKEDVKHRLCGRCSLEYDVDGICVGCKTIKRRLNEDGVCLECSAGAKSSKRIATHQAIEHTFEFWLGIRIENEAIQTTIYDSEERQARILDTYKKTMAALASVLRSAEDTEVIYLALWTCPILPLFATPYFDARVSASALTLEHACEKAIQALGYASRQFEGVRIFPGHCFGLIDGALHTPPGIVRECIFRLESADIPIAQHTIINWENWTRGHEEAAKALMASVVAFDPRPSNENDGDRIMFDMLAKTLGYRKDRWQDEWDSCLQRNNALVDTTDQEVRGQGAAAATAQDRSSELREGTTNNLESAATQAPSTVQPVAPAQRNFVPSAAGPSGSYKWAIVYGWFVMAAAAYLLLAAVLTLLIDQDATPRPSPFVHSTPMGAGAALFQGLLWLASGLAILKRKLIAIRLMWAGVILAGLGVLFRGIAPLELLVWLLSVAIAKWFSSKRPFLSK